MGGIEWQGSVPRVLFPLALLFCGVLLANCQAAMVTSKQDLCSLDGHWYSYLATSHNRVLVPIHSGISAYLSASYLEHNSFPV